MIHYVEASAAVKLLVDEAESPALARHLDDATSAGDLIASSFLLETELRRFAIRVALDQSSVTQVLSRINLVDLERAQFRVAGLLAGTYLRGLDAVHVAAAFRLDAEAMLTYDDRQARAAEAAGIRTVAPGSTTD